MLEYSEMPVYLVTVQLYEATMSLCFIGNLFSIKKIEMKNQFKKPTLIKTVRKRMSLYK